MGGIVSGLFGGGGAAKDAAQVQADAAGDGHVSVRGGTKRVLVSPPAIGKLQLAIVCARTPPDNFRHLEPAALVVQSG